MEAQYQTQSEVVRLVQKLYNAPLNPEVIRPVSSIMVVPINTDMEPSVLDISSIKEHVSPCANEPFGTFGEVDICSVEDSIIFIPPQNESQVSTDEDCATDEGPYLFSGDEYDDDEPGNDILQNAEEASSTNVKTKVNDKSQCLVGYNSHAMNWKDCKQYINKKRIPRPKDVNLKRKLHDNWLAVRKKLSVNPSYINVENHHMLVDTGDPMSRLLKVDEARSLMTQEYVSSVLSALDTDLSYSIFDEEKNGKVENNIDIADLSPRVRAPFDSEAPPPLLRFVEQSPIYRIVDAGISTIDANTIIQIMAAAPVIQTAGETRVIQTAEETRVIQTAQETHVIQTVEEAPVIHTIEGTPVIQTMDGTSVIQTVDGTSVIQTVDGTSVIQTMNGSSVIQTMEGTPVLQLLGGNTGQMIKIEDTRCFEELEDNRTAIEIPEYGKTVTWQRLPDNLCRVCAKTSPDLTHVFSAKGKHLRLADLIHTHLPILVTPDDVLPLFVCSSCISRLTGAAALVNTCVEADNTLRTLLELAQGTPVEEVRQEGNDIVDDSSATKPSLPPEPEVDAQIYEDPEDSEGIEDADVVETPQTLDTEPAAPKEKVAKGNLVDFSKVLSKEDVALINKMKTDGLKVTLVRVPNMENLTEDKKEKRVMHVLRTMNSNKSLKKKPIGTISLKSCAEESPESAAHSRSLLKVNTQLPGASNDTLCPEDPPHGPEVSGMRSAPATEQQGTPTTVSQTEANPASSPAPPEPSAATTVTSSADIAAPEDGKVTTATASASKSSVASVLQADLMDGISNAIKMGDVAKTGTIIKLNHDSGPGPGPSRSASSIYVYVRNKECSDSPQLVPQTILDLKALGKVLEYRKDQIAQKLARKAARHQAAVARRRARLLEKRRLMSEKRALTCVQCGAVFKTKEEVLVHRRDHLKCRFCGKQFTKRPNMREHERVHTQEKPYICDQCGRPFRTRAQMMQHQQRHNSDNPYMCQICGQRFSVRKTYKAHVSRHSTEEPYLCEMCGKSFKLQVTLRLHRLSHRSVTCKICDKTFSYRAHQVHKLTHRGDDVMCACSFCGKKFLTMHRLKIHLLIHEATYPFSCGVCKRSFKRMTHLQAHQARHTAEQLEGVLFFCCAICHTDFEKPSMLSQHHKTHSEEERRALKSYRCDTCNKCFSTERELHSHEMRHVGKQTFSCSTCNQAFDTKREFDAHSDSHTEERPFACGVCGKRFRNLINLNSHQQIHLAIKPYPCTSCSKSFKTLNGLNQHKLVHSEVRKHMCSICNMGFKRRDARKNHERTHFAERPYACSVCGRAFKVKADCSTHLKRHREAGIEGSIMESCYSCPVCSATFTLKVELSTHVQNAHDLEVAVLDKDDNLVLVPEVEIF